MAIRTLTMDGFIQELKDMRKGTYKRKFCFVLGAGASKSSGIKTGKELVDRWDKELQRRNPEEYEAWRTAQGITDENKYNNYGRYYAKRFERDNKIYHHDGYNYLEALMNHAQPQIGYLQLAMVMNDTPNNVVITTNFDHLIEDCVIKFCENIPLVIGHEALAHYAVSKQERPVIVKIHRDLLMDPINDPKQLAQLNSEWDVALNAIFSEYHPVFIGYAGNDQSVMNYLADNAKKFASGMWHYPYWTVYQREEPEAQVKAFLEDSGAWLIRNNGFDDMMIRIGQALDCKIPPKEKFVERIEKQYDAWMDAAAKCQTEQQDPKQDAAAAEEPVPGEGPTATAPEQEAAAAEQPVPEAELTETSSGQDEQESADTIYFDALMKWRLGQYYEALPRMQKAVQMEPKDARYHHGLAVTLHSLGRYEEALPERRQAIALEPNNAEYHYGLAVTLHSLGRNEEDLSENQKAIALEPDNAKYHHGLAVMLHSLGRYEEALPESQKSVALEPDNAKYHYGLAATLHSLGRNEEELSENQKAIALEPDHAEYHHGLAITLRALGRDDEADAEDKKADELEKK